MSGSTLGGLPSYVLANVWEYGIGGAIALATVQQRGSDSSDARTYYGAVIMALQAINGGAVPAIPAFGATPTQDYAYGLVAQPSLAVVGHISDWSYGRSAITLTAAGLMSWLYGRASVPALAATAAMA